MACGQQTLWRNLGFVFMGLLLLAAIAGTIIGGMSAAAGVDLLLEYILYGLPALSAFTVIIALLGLYGAYVSEQKITNDEHNSVLIMFVALAAIVVVCTAAVTAVSFSTFLSISASLTGAEAGGALGSAFEGGLKTQIAANPASWIKKQESLKCCGYNTTSDIYATGTTCTASVTTTLSVQWNFTGTVDPSQLRELTTYCFSGAGGLITSISAIFNFADQTKSNITGFKIDSTVVAGTLTTTLVDMNFGLVSRNFEIVAVTISTLNSWQGLLQATNTAIPGFVPAAGADNTPIWNFATVSLIRGPDTTVTKYDHNKARRLLAEEKRMLETLGKAAPPCRQLVLEELDSTVRTVGYTSVVQLCLLFSSLVFAIILAFCKPVTSVTGQLNQLRKGGGDNEMI